MVAWNGSAATLPSCTTWNSIVTLKSRSSFHRIDANAHGRRRYKADEVFQFFCSAQLRREFDVVASALVINDRLGGRHVSQLLDHLAEATRAQLRIQHEVRAQQGRTVLSARIVAVAPLVALVGLRVTNPRYLGIFDSSWGQLVLLGCALSIALGYAAMLYLTRLPGQRRVLVR